MTASTIGYTTFRVIGYFPVLYLHHCLQSMLCQSEGLDNSNTENFRSTWMSCYDPRWFQVQERK